MAALRQGGHGALSATWRAAETGRGRPWSVGFSAQGRDFAPASASSTGCWGPGPG